MRWDPIWANAVLAAAGLMVTFPSFAPRPAGAVAATDKPAMEIASYHGGTRHRRRMRNPIVPEPR